jgi:hypothetical protein
VSNVIYIFTVQADVPQGTAVQLAESIVATAVAQAMNLAGLIGNVSAQLVGAQQQTSVASFNPNATAPVPVTSPGTSTFIGAPARVVTVPVPNFTSSAA